MINFKILVVDDNVENIQTILRILEESHPEYRLYQANGGHAAFELARKISFDIILTDLDMPVCSGFELIQLLKSDIKTSRIPVIIFTGVMLSPEDLSKSLSAGAVDFIRKPVEPIELCARVDSAMISYSVHLKELEQKNINMAEKTLNLINNNRFIIKIAIELNKFLERFDLSSDEQEMINKLIEEINQTINTGSWQNFEIAFQNIYSDFCKNLVSKYPGLTPGELKHCILLKLGINIKDMASLLYQSPKSLKVARSRLRKKLEIPANTNFFNFLASF